MRYLAIFVLSALAYSQVNNPGGGGQINNPLNIINMSTNSVFSSGGGLAANSLNVNFSNLSNPYSNGWENFNGLAIEYNDLGGWSENFLTGSYSKKDFMTGLY